MNKLFLLLILLLASISLEAYTKRVILVSFSTQERAETMMKKLPILSPSLYALAKKHNFNIRLKKSGKYYIIVAEVFENRGVLNEALKKIKKRFKGAYVSNYTYPKKEKIKEILEIVPKPKVLPKVQVVEKPKAVFVLKEPEVKREVLSIVVKEIEKKIEKVDEIVVPKIIENKAQREAEKEDIVETFLKYFEWSYIIIILLSFVGIRYYIKFKRIYDEY